MTPRCSILLASGFRDVDPLSRCRVPLASLPKRGLGSTLDSMNDPHVVAVIYRVRHNETVDYGNANAIRETVTRKAMNDHLLTCHPLPLSAFTN